MRERAVGGKGFLVSRCCGRDILAHHAPRAQAAAPPGRKWIWFLAAPVGVAALAAFLYGYFVGFNVAVKPGDRALVVTIDDVKPLPEGITKVDSAEKLTRLVHTDGSTEVSYEYDTTLAARPIYLLSTVTDSLSARDALQEFLGRSAAVKLGSVVTSTPLDETPRDDLLKWGDQSRSMLLTVQGQPAGNYFLARKGTLIFSLMLSGVHLDKPESFRKVVQPHLDHLAAAGL